MIPSAILFGSIGTLVETSELQRQAFNNAFAGAGLDWQWSKAEYALLVQRPGGRRRVATYAEAKGQSVDVDAIYQAKQRHFAALMQAAPMAPRQGVAEVLADAKARGIKTGFVTTTSQGQVDLVLNALRPVVPDDAFDLTTSNADVGERKPSPNAYHFAVRRLGVDPSMAVAIEDTPESAMAALRAGITCFVRPGAIAKTRDFPQAVRMLDNLCIEELLPLQLTAAE